MDFETVEKREKDDVVIWCPDVVRKLGAALTLDTEMVTRPRSPIEPVENLFQTVKGQRLMAEMC